MRGREATVALLDENFLSRNIYHFRTIDRLRALPKLEFSLNIILTITGKGLAHGLRSLCLGPKKSPPILFHVPFKLSETCNLCTFCIQIIVNLRNYTLIENIIDIENALMLILLLNNVFAIYCNLLKDCYREFSPQSF